ncbi:MAG TPA: hypothetical protein VGM02_00855 [Acidobacteriaceae bacterium]|jgi:hypothetical protein
MHWYWLALLWIVAALVIASHRPSSLLHAQFWAEDGRVWYAQAYEEGPLLPLTHTRDGYFQTLPRLFADASLEVPFHRAPLVMNILALLAQGLPVVFVLSRRGENWGSLRVRSALALLYLCLPNSAEWHANTTNTQWVLALLASMVLLAKLPSGWAGRVADLAVLVLCGLTGPFCILLIPVAGAMAWWRRERWRVVYAACVVAFAAVQGYAVFTTRHSARIHHPLGASAGLLARILTVRIFTGALLGSLSPLASLSVPWIVAVTIAIASLALMAWALWRAPLELRLFTLFAAEVLAAALRTPMVHSFGPQWLAFLELANARYYLLPMLAFLMCLGNIALRPGPGWLRGIAIALLCIFPIGAVHNWHDFGKWAGFSSYEAGFRTAAQSFESAPAGTVTSFPIEPGWTMTLTKH